MSEGQNQFHISGIRRRFDSYLSHPQFGREEFDIAAVPKYISFYEKVHSTQLLKQFKKFNTEFIRAMEVDKVIYCTFKIQIYRQGNDLFELNRIYNFIILFFNSLSRVFDLSYHFSVFYIVF